MDGNNSGRLQFFNLVKAMRAAQKEYFSTRSQQALQQSKELEKRVDDCIKRGDEYLQRQKEPSLFD